MRGSDHMCYNSLSIDFYSAAALGSDFSYLWFALKRIASRSDLIVASSIGDRPYRDPFWIMFTILFLSSW